MAASGALEQLESHPGYYQALLAAQHQAPLTESIHAGEAVTPGLSATQLLLLKLKWLEEQVSHHPLRALAE